MSDRLRKLDALFAKRVLGIRFIHLSNGDEVIESDSVYSTLPCYTRSLDAAWEGLRIQAVSAHFDFLSDGGWLCCLTYDNEYTSTGSHPAEALVLACLRAAGVNEEELSVDPE